jgi:hypothetical protein
MAVKSNGTLECTVPAGYRDKRSKPKDADSAERKGYVKSIRIALATAAAVIALIAPPAQSDENNGENGPLIPSGGAIPDHRCTPATFTKNDPADTIAHNATNYPSFPSTQAECEALTSVSSSEAIATQYCPANSYGSITNLTQGNCDLSGSSCQMGTTAVYVKKWNLDAAATAAAQPTITLTPTWSATGWLPESARRCKVTFTLQCKYTATGGTWSLAAYVVNCQ